MSRRRLLRTGLLVLLLAVGGALLGAEVRGPATPPTRAEQVHTIASGLRCPVCRDLSVADSPAPLARQMRTRIARELATGESPDAIRAGFVASYGESVLLSPPRRGLGWVIAVLPVLLLATGLGAGALLLRGWHRSRGARAPAAAPEPVSAADRRRLERALLGLREEEP